MKIKDIDAKTKILVNLNDILRSRYVRGTLQTSHSSRIVAKNVKRISKTKQTIATVEKKLTTITSKYTCKGF